MGSPFVKLHGVGAANVARRAARHSRSLGVLPHCRSLRPFAGALCALAHTARRFVFLRLPASLDSVAGDSLSPPGVLSTDHGRMNGLLGSLERAVPGRAHFFYLHSTWA